MLGTGGTPGATRVLPPRRADEVKAAGYNLPAQHTSFVGRERESAEVTRLLQPGRLVTVLGTGGLGKTRLVTEVATDAVDDPMYPDGVWMVELAPLDNPALVSVAAAAALGLGQVEEGSVGLPDAAAVAAALGPTRRLLLVLDNAEHVLEACAELASTLLTHCPGVALLATSRRPLGIEGELAWRLPPLPVPPTDTALPPQELTAYAAPRLFADRAALARPGFSLRREDGAAVAHICRVLDGIPLALELAAARVRLLSVQQIATRLDDRLHLLTVGGPGASQLAAPRHRTLQAAIDWSYALLTDEEQRLFRRLSVFVGGFMLEASEAVCTSEVLPAARIFELLAALVDHSLVVAEPDRSNGEVRYRLLEPIRAYALERLHADEQEEVPRLRDRHADWAITFAESAGSHLSGPEQGVWLDRFSVEHDNLRAALGHLLAAEDGATSAARLAAALWRFWSTRGLLREGSAWLERALASEHLPDSLRARLFIAAGNLAGQRSDHAGALTLYREALPLLRAVNERKGVAAALNNMGLAAQYLGDFSQAVAWHQESLAIKRDLGDEQGIASSLSNLGLAAHYQGHHRRAVAYLEESLARRRASGDLHGIAISLNNLAEATRALGQRERALRYGLEALALFIQVEAPQGMAEALEGLAYTTAALGDDERAAWYLGAHGAQRRAGGSDVPPVLRASFARFVDDLRKRLGSERFARAHALGASTPVDRLLEEAPARRIAAPRPSSPRAARPSEDAARLSEREREVARLVAQGRTNRQIAETLVIAEGTATNHVKHILAKLGFSTRSQVAAWAAEHLPPD